MKIRTPETRKLRQIHCRKKVWWEAPHTYTFNNHWSDPTPTRFKYCKMEFGAVDAGVDIRYTN